jgi:hypothetical protein
MPLFRLSGDGIAQVAETTFSALGIRERGDLQRILRANVAVIAPDTRVIAEEFSGWAGSQRRIDLLAVDREANLVVIELKRDEVGGHMELQALRYAAMVARLTFEQAVDEYTRFLSRSEGAEDAQTSLLEFLGWDEPKPEFAQDVRIILAAADFSQELVSTVLWLNQRNLDIRCVRLKPYSLDSTVLINVEQIVPLPEAEDYEFQYREKLQEQRQASARQRGESVLDTAIASGLLRVGDRLHLVRPPRAGVSIPDERAKWVTYEREGRYPFRWDLDGEFYSLSGLCRELCIRYGGALGAGAFRGPDYWALDGDSEPLTERVTSQKPSASVSASEDASSIRPPHNVL